MHERSETAVPALIGAEATEAGVAAFLAERRQYPPAVTEAGMRVVESFGALAGAPDDPAAAAAADEALRQLDLLMAGGA